MKNVKFYTCCDEYKVLILIILVTNKVPILIILGSNKVPILIILGSCNEKH